MGSRMMYTMMLRIHVLLPAIITADFFNLPYSSSELDATAVKTKRALGTITYEPDPVNFNTSLVLNDTTIFEYDPYFTATLDKLELDLSVNVGAKIVYNVLTSTLGKFTFSLTYIYL